MIKSKLPTPLLLFSAIIFCTLLLPVFTFAQTPAVVSCISVSGPALKLGSSGVEVMQIQKLLNQYPDTQIAVSGAGSPGFETEYFGGLTLAAVKKFQQKFASEILVPAGLTTPTGLVGQFTRTKMNSLCSALNAQILSTASTSETMARTSSTKTAGVCGVVVNSCAKGTFKDSSDTRSLSKWSCIGIARGTTASCSVSKSSSGTPTAPTTPVVVPTSTTPVVLPNTPSTQTLQWGAYSGYSPADLASFEKLVGKQVKIKAVFTNWNESFPIYAVDGLKANNKILVIYWEQYGVTLDSIIAGNHDEYIKKFATEAKNYGGEVILSPLHEMNGNWDPWGGTVGNNTPAKVVLAWKKIKDTFGTVSNVKFAWAVNNISVPDTAANAIEKYYPGDAYVDYVAVDGFNFGNPWQSFDTMFAKSLTAVSVYNKPIYILSMGSGPGSSANAKAAWITDALGVQIKKYPLIKGWVWFNENKERDWRINSDEASLAAFKGVLQ